MYLTGSRALDYYLGRTGSNSDWDIVAEEYELNDYDLTFAGKDCIKHGQIEFINIECLNNRDLCYDFATDNTIHLYDGLSLNILSPTALYISKRSHVWRPLKFAKHIRELHLIKDYLKKNDEWPLSGYENALLKNRTQLTKEKYGHRAPSLNKTNEEFFDDFVTKYYIHDDLHKVVAYYDEPIYERLKNDSSLAKCEKDLWNQLSHEDKVKCVREECYVIALERYIIPFKEKGERYMPSHIAFNKAQERVCTTLTSGWFRDFAIDNWSEIRSDIVDFLSLFLEKENSLRRIK